MVLIFLAYYHQMLYSNYCFEVKCYCSSLKTHFHLQTNLSWPDSLHLLSQLNKVLTFFFLL